MRLKYEYYRDYANLHRHYQKAHFVCNQKECAELKFQVFESEVELRGHTVAMHPTVQVDRRVPVNFIVRRAGAHGEGVDADGGSQLYGSDGAVGGGSSSPSNNEIDTMDFPYLPGQDDPQGNATAPTSTTPPATPSSRADFPGLQAPPPRGPAPSGYSAVVGFNPTAVLASQEHFPSLAASAPARPAGTGSINAVRPGHDFRSAVDAPYRNLDAAPALGLGSGLRVVHKKKGGKGGRGGAAAGADDAPPSVQWKSRDELEREVIAASTVSVPVPPPQPVRGPAAREPAVNASWGSGARGGAQQRGGAPAPPSATALKAQREAAATQVLARVATLLAERDQTEFKTLCGLFARREITAEAFYRAISAMLPAGEFPSMLDLLLLSQPDKALQAELRAAHERRAGPAASAPAALVQQQLAQASLEHDVALVRPKGDGEGWARPRGAGKGARDSQKDEEYPMLPKADTGAGKQSALAQWDDFQRSSRISSDLKVGTKPGKPQPQKQKKKNDDVLFWFGAAKR